MTAGSDGMKHIIDTACIGLSLADFQKQFPEVEITSGEEKDYDPSFWEKTIRHTKFAAAREEIEGVGFSISISFFHRRMSFLQYYGEIGSGESGFAGACRAFGFLADRMEKNLGRPERAEGPVSSADFLAATRTSSGPPDERFVAIAAISWKDAFVACEENAYGRIVIRLRLGA